MAKRERGLQNGCKEDPCIVDYCIELHSLCAARQQLDFLQF